MKDENVLRHIAKIGLNELWCDICKEEMAKGYVITLNQFADNLYVCDKCLAKARSGKS